MVPVSSKVFPTKTGLFVAGEDHPHRANMSPSEVALQIECAEPPSTSLLACKNLAGFCVLGKQRGRGQEEEDEDEGAVCPCLAHLADASPVRIQSVRFPGLQEGRKSSSGAVHTPLYSQGREEGHTDMDLEIDGGQPCGTCWGRAGDVPSRTGGALAFTRVFLLPAELASFACSGVSCCTGLSSGEDAEIAWVC